MTGFAGNGGCLAARHALALFICFMDTRVEEDRKGECPICGMDLMPTEVYR